MIARDKERGVGVSPASSLELPDFSDDPSRPQLLSENEPFVQILDPATGTATLTDEDIAHYHKIVIALSHTIRLMAEIDQVIETHGGWPGAFHAAKSPQD